MLHRFCGLSVCLLLVVGVVSLACAGVILPAAMPAKSAAAVITALHFDNGGLQPVLTVGLTRRTSVAPFRSVTANGSFWVAELIDAVPANDAALLLTSKPDPQHAVTVTPLVAGGINITRIAIGMEKSDVGRRLLVEQQDGAEQAPDDKVVAPSSAASAVIEMPCMSSLDTGDGAFLLTSVTGSGSTASIGVAGGKPHYRWFQLVSPRRLVIDLLGTSSRLGAGVHPLKMDAVRRARIGLYQDKVRVVFDLTAKPSNISVVPTACGLKLTIKR